jgi:hypothetical protein
MKYLLLCFVIVLSFMACKKPAIESINTNNSRDSLTYQPKVAGSKWTYVRNALGQNVTYNFTRLSYDSSAYGNPFPVFSSDIDANQYIRQDVNKYYTILTGSTLKPELLVLDVSKNINDSWVGGTNGNDTYTYTIKDKIPSYILDGFTFRNVIKVYSERRTTSGGTSTVTLSGNVYYAQGIGQIQLDGFVVLGGTQVPVSTKVINVDLK